MGAEKTNPGSDPTQWSELEFSDGHGSGGSSGSKHRKGSSTIWVVLGIFALALVGGGVYASNQFRSPGDPALTGEFKTHEVKKGNLVVTVTESGNLESAVNVDLKCEVEGGTTILEIATDGTQAKKGDVLITLDSSGIEEKIDTQKITVEQSLSTKISAEKDVNVAKISLKEYLEGAFVTELQTIESNIFIAHANLKSAEDALGHAEKMLRKGYVTQLQYDEKDLAVQRAKLDLELRETEKKTLEQFTKAKSVEELQSKIETAEAKLKSEQEKLASDQSKLKKLEAQLLKCSVLAPQDGMVVWANDLGAGRFGQQGPKIEQGAAVKQYQAMIKLPDLSKMQVKVLVNETKVAQLYPGLPAEIKIQDRVFTGEITSVSNQPDAGDWFGGSVKKFATFVRVTGQHSGLKPGMTSEVTMLVAELKDVLTVPPQAIVEKGKGMYCWVVRDGQTEKRKVEIGKSNDTAIQIKTGVEEGEIVLLNPRKMVKEAGEDDNEESEEVDAAKKFGKTVEEKADEPEKTESGSTSAAAPAASEATKPAAESKDGAKASAADGAKPAETAAPADGVKSANGAASGGPGVGAGGPGKGPGGPGGGGGRMKPKTFKEIDTDKDGKISKDEMRAQLPEQFRDRLDQFWGFLDTDGDDFVSKEEHKIAEENQKKMQQQQQQGGGGGRGPGGPG